MHMWTRSGFCCRVLQGQWGNHFTDHRDRMTLIDMRTMRISHLRYTNMNSHKRICAQLLAGFAPFSSLAWRSCDVVGVVTQRTL